MSVQYNRKQLACILLRHTRKLLPAFAVELNNDNRLIGLLVKTLLRARQLIALNSAQPAHGEEGDSAWVGWIWKRLTADARFAL